MGMLRTRVGVTALALMAFLAGASLTLFSEEGSDATVGAKTMQELRALDEAHGREMANLRQEARVMLKTVARARSDKSMAAEAEAVPAKLSALLNKLLDAEAAHRVKREGVLVAQRDALIAELGQHLLNGKSPHPRLICDLLPSVTTTDSERAEWNDLFKVARRSGRFEEDGGDEDEGVD